TAASPPFVRARTACGTTSASSSWQTSTGDQANADEAWRWYQARSQAARTLVPHPGYAAVRQIGDHADRLTIVTQNVDGLHARSGSSDVLELHGSLREVRCLECGVVE